MRKRSSKPKQEEGSENERTVGGAEQTVESDIRRLYLENKKILDRIGDIEQQEHDLLIKKSECILALAGNFEKLHALGDYKEPIHAICATIVGLVRDERGFFTHERWIRDILPYQYRESIPSIQIPEPLATDFFRL